MDYREIARLQQSAVATRSLARLLLSLTSADFTQRDKAFLSDMARIEDGHRITTAQGEYLLGLRERATRRSIVAKHRVSELVGRIWIARDDLDEEQQEWLGALVSHGADLAVSERQWARLCGLAKRLGLMDDEFISFAA